MTLLEIVSRLKQAGYVASSELAMMLHLQTNLDRPLLLEGPASAVIIAIVSLWKDFVLCLRAIRGHVQNSCHNNYRASRHGPCYDSRIVGFSSPMRVGNAASVVPAPPQYTHFFPNGG